MRKYHFTERWGTISCNYPIGETKLKIKKNQINYDKRRKD